VMIAEEKAKTSLDLLMEIRNKSLDMYKNSQGYNRRGTEKKLSFDDF